MPSTGLEETCSRRSSSGMSNPSSAYWTAASRNAWLRRSDSRPASGDSFRSHAPSCANGGGTTTSTAGAPPPGPSSLVSATSASFIAPWAAWYAFTPGRNRSFVARSMTTASSGACVCSATGRKVSPFRFGFERDVEHGRAAVLPFLDHVDVVAELALQDARPSVPSSQALLRRGLVAPGIRVAVAEDRGQVTPRCRSARSPRLRSACPARRPRSWRSSPRRRSRRSPVRRSCAYRSAMASRRP